MLCVLEPVSEISVDILVRAVELDCVEVELIWDDLSTYRRPSRATVCL